ncbi:Nramp family divalent metal transporter [Sphingomonas sp. JC676]|uniref:Nramp family divalent metal transporter n=1 Tax=Sphingomonas sp. JC676 TaxID=2768065 RepID=UPI001658233A|nr:Nramp family divalent metal transporter [Sphingomonas sp. JC676]MBC9035166.1 Nramp family divalent metal transporter [Sphingomonas sp. JC676]
MRLQLPRVASAPFCPAEVQGTIAMPSGLPGWRKLLRFAGPGLLVAVGYMDPGNWATDIEAGSRYGYDLLFVVVLCGLAAMLLQWLAMRLGLVARRDLARMARERYSPAACRLLWLLAELAIVATDIAEVLGTALAFNLLLGVPLWAGVLLTGLDTLIVLGLKGHGFRQLEAIVLGLILTIALCFATQLAIVGPSMSGLLHGVTPKIRIFAEPHALYLAVGILGATVMPHNLYLHSSVVQTRLAAPGPAGTRDALRFATIDILAALILATLVNAAILTLSAATFHSNGFTSVAEIEDAYRLLEPITGAAAAALLFGIALLASGQSATFTGTIAGQVILEGFLDLNIPCWQRRVITRGLALVPALAGVLWLGEHAVGKLLVLTQVVLSLQLPFAVYPLIRFTSDREIMGAFASGPLVCITAWSLFGLVVAANLWLVGRWLL